MEKKTYFWKIYRIVLSVSLVLIAGVLCVLYMALADYEDRQQLASTTPVVTQPEVVATTAPVIVEETEERGVAVVAPNTYKVLVNGIEMGKKDVYSESDLGIKEDFAAYLTDDSAFPKMVAYYVADVDESVTVECFDAAGNKLELTDGGYPFYQYNLKEDQISDDRVAFFNEMIDKYVHFCMNEGELSSVLGYFVKDTDTYNKICKMDGVKNYSGKHTGLEIGDVNFTQYHEYTSDVYHVKCEFSYTVIAGDKRRDNPTTLDCYVAKINGQWKIFRMDIS